jgi:competence protein ComEA
MRPINLREILSKIIFRFQNLIYLSKKHYYITVFIMLLIILLIFSSVFIKQKREIESKEKIVRSYYEDGYGDYLKDGGSAGSGTDAGEKDTVILVHVCGEVAGPGVYELDDGTRIIDLIDAAGGETENACLDSLNLAQKVFDGQKIYVPSREEVSEGFFNVDNDAADTYGENGYVGILNINTASLKQLEDLPGIGPVIGGNIINYRSTHGPFEKKEDIINVNGIGTKKFEMIRDLIDV